MKENFLIERFIKDLSTHFQDILENEIYYVDLFWEKIYKIKEGEKKAVIASYHIFKNLHDFRKSYEELFETNERIGFEYKNIFFMPVPRPASVETKKWFPLIKFQKGKSFNIPTEIKMNIILLDEVYQVE